MHKNKTKLFLIISLEYGNNKMRMHLEAIDVDLWYVVENGVPKAGEGVTAADVKKFTQLDSTAKNIICGHLTKVLFL